MSNDDLEKRITALEGIEAIKVLKARYSVYCDDSYNPDAIADLFIDDGVWDGGGFGRYEGRAAIREFFSGASQILPFAVHMVMNPIIEVDGDTAKGTWYFFGAFTLANGNRAAWGSSRYDDEYVKVNGNWMYKSLRATPFFWTPFDEGWVKEKFAV